MRWCRWLRLVHSVSVVSVRVPKPSLKKTWLLIKVNRNLGFATCAMFTSSSCWTWLTIELHLYQLLLDSLSLSSASEWTRRGRCGHGCWLHGRMVRVESGSGWWRTARLAAEGLGVVFNHQRDHGSKTWRSSLLHEVSIEQFTWVVIIQPRHI